MKFDDGTRTLEIRILDHRNSDEGQDWTADFFDDAPEADENGVTHIDDVEYPLDYARDMLHGEGDFDEPSPSQSVDWSMTDNETGRMLDSGYECSRVTEHIDMYDLSVQLWREDGVSETEVVTTVHDGECVKAVMDNDFVATLGEQSDEPGIILYSLYENEAAYEAHDAIESGMLFHDFRDDATPFSGWHYALETGVGQGMEGMWADMESYSAGPVAGVGTAAQSRPNTR